MKLKDILRVKGAEVHSVWPTATLQDVVDLLVQHNCGSLVVLENGELRGIITERDILRAAATVEPPLAQHAVKDHMSTDLVVGNPEHSLATVMGMLTEHRVRHLPVISDESLVGIVSIGDVVKAQHQQLSMENHYLKNYIQS